MEKETFVQPVRITYECDDCKKGKMDFTGKAYTKWHTHFEHKCNHCGKMQDFENISYPYIGYKEIETRKKPSFIDAPIQPL